jgi:hypothetical protein
VPLHVAWASRVGALQPCHAWGARCGAGGGPDHRDAVLGPVATVQLACGIARRQCPREVCRGELGGSDAPPTAGHTRMAPATAEGDGLS